MPYSIEVNVGAQSRLPANLTHSATKAIAVPRSRTRISEAVRGRRAVSLQPAQQLFYDRSHGDDAGTRDFLCGPCFVVREQRYLSLPVYVLPEQRTQFTGAGCRLVSGNKELTECGSFARPFRSCRLKSWD